MTNATQAQSKQLSLQPVAILVAALLAVIISVLLESQDSKSEELDRAALTKWFTDGGAMATLPAMSITQEQAGLQPSLVFTGKGAQALTLGGMHASRRFDEFSQALLVRSASGTYFTVELNISPWRLSRSLNECAQSPPDCARWSDPKVVTLDEAQALFFHAKTFTEASYRAFFGVNPPPRSTPV